MSVQGRHSSIDEEEMKQIVIDILMNVNKLRTGISKTEVTFLLKFLAEKRDHLNSCRTTTPGSQASLNKLVTGINKMGVYVGTYTKDPTDDWSNYVKGVMNELSVKFDESNEELKEVGSNVIMRFNMIRTKNLKNQPLYFIFFDGETSVPVSQPSSSSLAQVSAPFPEPFNEEVVFVQPTEVEHKNPKRSRRSPKEINTEDLQKISSRLDDARERVKLAEEKLQKERREVAVLEAEYEFLKNDPNATHSKWLKMQSSATSSSA